MMLARLGFALARPILSGLDAEAAHGLTLKALKLAPPLKPPPSNPALTVDCIGLQFPNPLGLAAGFDKDGDAPRAMLGLGLSFVELGTVTPRPQDGNPKPRLFRLDEEAAVINRMGFNNHGHAALHAKLKVRPQGIIGVNLGANKDATDRAADYVSGVERFADAASYFTVNISSPNTPGLRGLQQAEELRPLLARLNAARAKAPRLIPMLLKIAPDLSDEELEAIARCCEGGAVDGVILTNTTTARPGISAKAAREAGGLSGRPLFALSTRQLARFYVMTSGKIPLIGAGGISSVEDAWAKLEAGASLLQLYTALVFQGPALIGDILQGLALRLQRENMASIIEVVGRRANEWATRSPAADSA